MLTTERSSRFVVSRMKDLESGSDQTRVAMGGHHTFWCRYRSGHYFTAWSVMQNPTFVQADVMSCSGAHIGHLQGRYGYCHSYFVSLPIHWPGLLLPSARFG